MTSEECHAKRNELNAMARKAEESGDPALGNRCRLMAMNLWLMASKSEAARERGAYWYEKNKFRFERDMAAANSPNS